MKIEHIIWREPDFSNREESGLCCFEIFYHGGGATNFIFISGRYDMVKEIFTDSLGRSYKIDEQGMSGSRLVKIGDIVP